MRSFKNPQWLALVATFVFLLTSLLAPVAPASADQYAKEHTDKYSIWWTRTTTPTIDCSKVNSTTIHVNVSKHISKGAILCSGYISNDNNGVWEKTSFKVVKRSRYRVDITVSLSATQHEDHYLNDGTGDVIRDTSEPWRMRLQVKGNKAAEWLWQKTYTYRNVPAKKLSIGSLHFITEEYIKGEDKGKEYQSESKMLLNFTFSSTR